MLFITLTTAGDTDQLTRDAAAERYAKILEERVIELQRTRLELEARCDAILRLVRINDQTTRSLHDRLAPMGLVEGNYETLQAQTPTKRVREREEVDHVLPAFHERSETLAIQALETGRRLETVEEQLRLTFSAFGVANILYLGPILSHWTGPTSRKLDTLYGTLPDDSRLTRCRDAFDPA
ncbi:hypothetical protein HY626_02100 [Candidatus Uhrbacteria bacterium]|nr:hypothetical protein [Candidatus Uhrbacteria bacterium]